jgi:ribose/xylose/arabinose/galactoside ABC-type transport system permease subunit
VAIGRPGVALQGRGDRLELEMTAIAKTISRLFLTESNYFDVVKQIALFSLAGLLVTLLVMTYGVDLSPGFF